MKKGLRIFFFIIIGLIILAIFLNPNTESFKNYARNLGDQPYIIYKRKANYFLFSIYIKQSRYVNKKYCGFAGNFFEIENDEIEDNSPSVINAPTVETKPPSLKLLSFDSNVLIWAKELQTFLNKKPEATNAEIYKKFPQLDNDSEKLVIVLAYNYQKNKIGTSEDTLKILYPELYK